MSHHIEHLIIDGLRIASAIAGGIFLYMAMFMYEDERGKQQNRLVNLWIKIKEREEASLSSQAALVKYASQLASLGINRVLGDRLLTLWTVSVSLSLSAASSLFVDSFAPDLLLPSKDVIPLGIAFLVYGLVIAPSLFGKGKKALAVTLLLTLGAITFLGAIFISRGVNGSNFLAVIQSEGALGVFIISFALAFGTSCDLALLAVNRLILRSMSASVNPSLLFFGAVYNLLWCLFLTDTLRLVFHVGSIDHDPLLRFIDGLADTGSIGSTLVVATLTVYAISTNLFTLLVSSSVLIVTGFALLHRLLWPIIGRFINAIYEWGIFANKKVQLSSGIGCLMFALPQVGKLLKEFAP